jgi:cell pole-organizing protein PopZ
MKTCLLILLMLSSTSTFAALNKWVDANGKVHYSDSPPPANVKAETLRTAPPANEPAQAGSAPAAPKTIAERAAELRKAEQEKKKAAEKAAQEQAKTDEKKTNCAMAQRNLQILQAGARMSDIDAKGERYYINDEQRQQRISKAQQDIDNWCQ